MAQTVQTSFQLDDGTAKAISGLKDVFGATTNTGVIRRAIALAMLVAGVKDRHNTITVLDGKKKPVKISLR